MIIDDLQDFCTYLLPNKPIISIDYGQKKIGVATSNPERTIAMPLSIIHESNVDSQIKQIVGLASSCSACAIVIGMPYNMDGSVSSQTVLVQKFAQNLSIYTELPLFMQDERLTSKAADSLLKSFGIARKTRNMIDDPVAASMILETVLDSINKLIIH